MNEENRRFICIISVHNVVTHWLVHASFVAVAGACGHSNISKESFIIFYFKYSSQALSTLPVSIY